MEYKTYPSFLSLSLAGGALLAGQIKFCLFATFTIRLHPVTRLDQR